MKSLAPRAISLLGLALGLSFSLSAWAGNTATQRITFSIQEATQISVSGDPAPMLVVAATPGTEPVPVPVTEASARYAIAANAGENAKKITAALDRDLPAGILLEVELAAPNGEATSSRRALSTQAVDLVTDIHNVMATEKAITYNLSAGSTEGSPGGGNLVVTYTVTNQI